MERLGLPGPQDPRDVLPVYLAILELIVRSCYGLSSIAIGIGSYPFRDMALPFRDWIRIGAQLTLTSVRWRQSDRASCYRIMSLLCILELHKRLARLHIKDNEEDVR